MHKPGPRLHETDGAGYTADARPSSQGADHRKGGDARGRVSDRGDRADSGEGAQTLRSCLTPAVLVLLNQMNQDAIGHAAAEAEAGTHTKAPVSRAGDHFVRSPQLAGAECRTRTPGAGAGTRGERSGAATHVARLRQESAARRQGAQLKLEQRLLPSAQNSTPACHTVTAVTAAPQAERGGADAKVRTWLKKGQLGGGTLGVLGRAPLRSVAGPFLCPFCLLSVCVPVPLPTNSGSCVCVYYVLCTCEEAELLCLEQGLLELPCRLPCLSCFIA